MTTIRDELLALVDGEGQLKPLIVLTWAQQHPGSALHRYLEWDDATAGHQYRLWQVRQCIAVNIVTPEFKREMISLTIDRHTGGGYRTVQSVMPVTHLRECALADALADLQRVQSKYHYLSELAAVWSEVSNVKKKRGTKRAARSQSRRPVAKVGLAKPSPAKPGKAGKG